MRTIRKAFILALSVAAVLAMTACSAKKKDRMQIFSDNHHEEYRSAAGKHFSSAGWTRADFLEKPEEHSVTTENMTMTLEIGTISEEDRYIVIIDDEENILEREPLEGKRYTILVYDNGSDNMKILMRYSVGTTDNCVAKGNVAEGEITVNKAIEIESSGVSDISERANLIFDVLYEALVDIEGK